VYGVATVADMPELELHQILTERVAIPVADATMGAYLARPAEEEPAAGVIVGMELFGVSAHVRDVCERLARRGYAALAPDFHHRVDPGAELAHDDAGRTRGFELLDAMTRMGAVADVAAGVDALRSGGCARVGMLGLSLGGHIAFLAAAHLPLDAVVVAYAGWLPTTDIRLSRPEPTLTLASRVAAPALVVVGEHDHVVPPADRSALVAALREAGVRHELLEVAGAGHGFLCDRRPGFDAARAGEGWKRIDAFLDAELSPARG
jgi:carboxymethylenebutenolidase